LTSITVNSGLHGHNSGCPKHRKWESLLCRKNLGFRLTPPGTIRATNSVCVGGAKTQGGTMTIWLIYFSDAQKSQCRQKIVLMRNPWCWRRLWQFATRWHRVWTLLTSTVTF